MGNKMLNALDELVGMSVGVSDFENSYGVKRAEPLTLDFLLTEEKLLSDNLSVIENIAYGVCYDGVPKGNMFWDVLYALTVRIADRYMRIENNVSVDDISYFYSDKKSFGSRLSELSDFIDNNRGSSSVLIKPVARRALVVFDAYVGLVDELKYGGMREELTNQVQELINSLEVLDKAMHSTEYLESVETFIVADENIAWGMRGFIEYLFSRSDSKFNASIL